MSREQRQSNQFKTQEFPVRDTWGVLVRYRPTVISNKTFFDSELDTAGIKSLNFAIFAK